MVEQEEEDRISKLPDEILSQILSILPMKEAIQTSILSTRWISLWTCIPTLDITLPRDEHKDKIETLSKFVESALVDHKMPHLQNVSVCCPELDLIVLKSWISASIQRNITHLKLFVCLWASDSIPELPQSLFSGCNLVQLVLNSVLMNFPVASPDCFPKLEILLLFSISFKDEDSATNLISSCPILQALHISTSPTRSFREITVSAPCLKLFIFQFFGSQRVKMDYVPKIIFNTPALEHINISDNVPHLYVVKDFSSLVSAEIHLFDMFTPQLYDAIPQGSDYYISVHVPELLDKISNVKSLTLSAAPCCTCLGASMRSLPTFCNLTNLEFHDCDNSYWDWKLVAAFLKSCPVLEVLAIEKSAIYHERQFNDVPSCLISHLKTIKISRFSGKYEVENIRYFLKNSNVLEKMILKGFVEETGEILTLARASPTCQIESHE